MLKRSFVFVIILILLGACARQLPEPAIDSPTSPEPSDSAPWTTPFDIQPPVTETPGDALNYVPGIRISASLEDGCAVIAALDNEWTTEPVYVYLYANQPVSDVLISGIYSSGDNEMLETEGALYVPELRSGQAIKLINAYPDSSDTENYYTRIAYVNGGDYETVLIYGDAASENPSLHPTEPGIFGAVYDADYLGNDQFIISDLLSAEFRDKTLAGEFDDYVPKGLCIAGGTLGDVNGDGTRDAVMYLITGGNRVAAYNGVMPLFILIGNADGGYSVAKKVPGALFTPYRSASYAIAGTGYIDIVYDYVGGAASHDTQVCRFVYRPDKNDWLLSALSYQPTYDLNYTERLASELVSSLPSMTDLPIEKQTGNEFYNCPPDWDYFDGVCELTVAGGVMYSLGVKFNDADGTYAGYIYKFYESLQSGGFTQTIRGEYDPDVSFEISADSVNNAFMVNQDVWKLDEHASDAFYLAV